VKRKKNKEYLPCLHLGIYQLETKKGEESASHMREYNLPLCFQFGQKSRRGRGSRRKEEELDEESRKKAEKSEKIDWGLLSKRKRKRKRKRERKKFFGESEGEERERKPTEEEQSFR
jgi:hypothetical protein